MNEASKHLDTHVSSTSAAFFTLITWEGPQILIQSCLFGDSGYSSQNHNFKAQEELLGKVSLFL